MSLFPIFIVLVVIAVILKSATGVSFFYNKRDDTDPPNERSGLLLFIDARTGCHYLGTSMGGITPRLDARGKHICEGGRS